MAKPNQVVETKSDKKSRPKVKPPIFEERTDELAGLAQLPGGPMAAAGDGTIEGQVARLGDTRFQTVQRQAIATDIGRLGGNRHLQRVIVSLAGDEGQEGADQEPAEFNVALYDYNLDHMHIRGEEAWTEARREAGHRRQREAFRGWAQRWARQNRAIGLDGVTPGRAIEMNSRQEILDGINDTYQAINRENVARNVPESQWRKIDTVAFFCHGSPDTGLVHLGVRNVRTFVAAIDRALSPHVRFLLFACSTGQGRWQPGMIRSESEVESESIREEEGGEGSWAARLAEALLRRGVDMGETWRGEVWGHTMSGSAVDLPNWRQFRARFQRLDPVTRRRIYAISGRSYFTYVFDSEVVATSFLYLRLRYEGMSAEARAARRREFPADAQDLRERWMYPFYTAITRGEIASRVPDDPDGCKERILSAWGTYYTGNSGAVISTDMRGTTFLLTNNFDDLPTHIPRRSL